MDIHLIELNKNGKIKARNSNKKRRFKQIKLTEKSIVLILSYFHGVFLLSNVATLSTILKIQLIFYNDKRIKGITIENCNNCHFIFTNIIATFALIRSNNCIIEILQKVPTITLD